MPAQTLTPEMLLVVQTATNLLSRIDNITTEDFSRGAERKEREALRFALKSLEAVSGP